MTKLLVKIFLTEIVLSVPPSCILGEYFDHHLRENHPILDAIETFVDFIFFQSLGSIGVLLFLVILYTIWTI
jgi:hypothetical protein